jgi:hypothetical protein
MPDEQAPFLPSPPRGRGYTDEERRVIALGMAIEAFGGPDGWAKDEVIEAAKTFETYLKGE